MVTGVPPSVVPELGEIDETVGSGLTVKVLEVVPANEPSLAVNVLVKPRVVGWRLLKAATPFKAVTESVLPPVKMVVLLLMATVLPSPVTVLPY